jgi:uncharacterized membrane protein
VNELIINFCIIYALIAAFMIARPWLSRKNVLFGVVFGSSEMRKEPDVKKIIGCFVAGCVAAAAAIAVVFGLYAVLTSTDASGMAALFGASVIIMIVLESVPYIWANRSLKKWKETIEDENLVSDRITVELGDESKRKPIRAAWFLLLLVPVAITIIIAAVYYQAMPDIIPVHFDFSGAADAWEIKSPGLVMAPITAQIILAAVMLLIGIFSRNAAASVKGSPGAAPGYSAFRRFLSSWIILFSLVAETQFIMTELQYAGLVSAMQAWSIAFIVLIIVLTMVLIITFLRMRREPQGKVYDDDNKWVLGMFYFNPADPSVFVEKRSGIGQTINFARPAAWIVMAVIVLVIVFAKVLSQK